ncbi:uncharacterized protein LOC127811427 isoform X2 [Diospyros lotus]|uniref:uncharacterized protein LOC127811427 isoform X2 n=1 Tax=Diospyros lotus TaxID=55363 RepID=UPI00224FD7E5|nr:uncharacterized protein LOC127811427 isoform X2 [Diospyros lotus]XP_052207250.1 uncharacterized protein LOC127811427 isoform X2 [Diospyros lotus]
MKFHIVEKMRLPFCLFFQPPTEKAHLIIARTALFVGKHGGQSEIVLRVKQGDNPTFGFLMPDHHLHAYFRFLVDHQELLQPGIDGKSENEKKIDSEYNQTDGVETGALSLLGSVYGYGEEEDGAVGNDPPESKDVPAKTLDASGATFDAEKTESSRSGDQKDEAIANRPSPPKEKVQVLKRNSFTSAFKSGSSNGVKKEGDSLGLPSIPLDKSLSSGTQNVSKVELLIVEPPSELKRLIDRIVEFILKNGRQFEAVLIEQDSKHGRFPFLLSSNQYHPYYLKVLQKAQESKLTFKSFNFEKDDLTLRRQDKKSTQLKESNLSLGSAGSDIPCDSDKKEKFRMVIGKSKKDGQDPPSKTNQPQFGVSVDAAAAAAILQAATRGIKNPNLGLLSGTLWNGEKRSRNSEGEQASISGCHLSPHPENIIQKPMQKGDPGVPISAGIAAAKTGYPEAADQADSPEAQMSKEQKLRAERLKRAKMFVAMLKTGAVPSKSDTTPRSLSVEPQDSAVSGSGDVVDNLAGKEQDSSSIPLDVGTLDKKEKSEKKCSDDEYHERRSRRKYRSRSSRHEEENEDDEEEDEDHKHVRKKHQSHRSSRDEGKEEDMEDQDHRHARKKHRSHRSSLEEGKGEGEDRRDHERSRKKHRSYHSSHEHEDEDEDEEEDYKEERHHKRSRKKHKSHRSSHHSRERHRHKDRHSSKKRESRHSRRHEKSSDDEHLHRSSSDKLKRASHSEEELEEGEISSKILDAGQEASKDVRSSDQSARAPLSHPEVPKFLMI